MTRIGWLKQNWKLTVHLLLGTKRFGVNNEWWSDFDSLFGIPWYKRTPRRILLNYKMAKIRAIGCHFISDEEKQVLFKSTKL